ncbi:two-partner secretion domain-containing protein [Pseudomonas protegens]|uniref:two-partner secretion domain-containing protein n=1 Tax=Pseudomonas protegens TaxID=380021 RepID=UPI003565B285
MDVRQFAFLVRQPSAALQSRDSFWGLPKRGLAFILANVMFWQPLVVMADGIVVNGSGTTLGQAGNGVPIVNIATPNGGGLSHNKFSDYNVGQQGVILNNATQKLQSTQLGGYIIGNPNLGGRAANVILNEVNGGSPSQLKGYTEVAGQSAHVIVANPYGVSCNGCGFINTPKATLTTGKPVIENGQIQRYQVDQGSVSIEGAGLNASNIDQFEIITRSAKINAEIQAKHLAVIAGANDVDAKTLNATARTANPADAPQLAIDSSALGGMYAGAIKLVGTEAGVGVKLAGDMATSGGDLQIDANGKLTLARAQARGDVQLKAQAVQLTESVYAERNAKVVAAEKLTVDKNLTAGGNLHLEGQQVVSRGHLNAGLQRQEGIETINPTSHLQLQGGSLTNTGSINARGSLTTDLERLDNQGAELVAAGELSLKAGSIDNRGGQLIGQQALKVEGSRLDNRGGTLAAEQTVKVVLDTLDNRDQGLILSKSADLTLNAGSLDNRQGTLQANQGELKARVKQVLDNGGGKILTGAGKLSLEADELRNQQGRLNAQTGKLEVKSATFDNSQGQARGAAVEISSSSRLINDQGHVLSTAGDLQLKGGEVRNNEGEIASQKHLQLSVDSLQNQKGSLSAETIGLALSGKLDNDAGLIESRESLAVDAGSVSNAKGRLRALGEQGESRFSIGGRFDNDQGLVEIGNQRLLLSSGGLSNQQGLVRHLGQQGFALSLADTGNAGGSFITNSRLDLDLADWSNTSQIQAQKIGLKVGTFTQTRSGKLISVEGIEASGNHWINDGGLETDGDLKLVLSGSYQGNGILKSQGRMTFAAARADLGQEAQVRSGAAADFTLGSHLKNLGTLTAAGDLQLKVDSLTNLGTLGAGNALHIETPTLVNQGGLIFSGADTQLEISSLTNDKGDIYSLGRLDVNAPGQQPASLIENISGTIESAHGMQLLANRLINRKEKFAFIPALTSGRITLHSTDNCKGKHCEAYYSVTEVYGTKITEDSQRGNLISGAELTFKGDSFENQFSTVSAAGDISLQSNSLKNVGAGGGEIRNYAYSIYTKDEGAYYTFVNNIGRYNAYNDPNSASYNPTAMPLGAIALGSLSGFSKVETSGSGEVAAAVIQGAGKVDITGTQLLENSVIRPGEAVAASASRVGLTTVDSSTQALPQLNLQAAPDLQQQAVNPLALPGFSLPQGDSGLFKVSRNPQHKYLIETNPAFANLKQFISSDYLLSRIGFNSDQTQRRLGDGLYEQRLIREAVIARTGQRFIAGLDSDEAMFRHLMDNAIASKTALDLSPGVALTSAQVAALTHDIVWMQEQEVNGEKVLVPVLYMAQANNRLAPNGALIQGRDVNLISGGTLANQGTLRASAQLQASAQNIDNSGLMEANERLSLLSTQSIRNAQGGILKGKDVSLVATQGDVINERSKVSQDTRYGGGVQHNDYLNSAARVEAGNSLNIDAGRDIRNSGSVLQAGGDASLKAGRDLEIVSTEQLNSSEGQGKKTRWSQSKITQHGSEVTTGGNLTASAGGDIAIVASTLKAAKSIDLKGEGDVHIASAANEESSEYHKKRGGKKVDIERSQVRQQSSVIEAGGELVVSAGGDLLLSSSHLKSGSDAYLYAGNQLALLAAQNSDYSLYDMKKKSGWGSKKTKRDEVTDVRHMGASITSGGSLTLESEGDQTYQVAKLESGKDITLDSGGAITFEGVKDLHQESHEKSSNSLAWTSAKGKGNTDETLRQSQLVAQGRVVIKAVDGLRIDLKQIDQKSVSQTIDAMVQADPQLAWLKEAEKRGDVDWRKVQETHDSFKYSHSGLGQGAMLAIMIIVTALTAGAASAALGTAAGATAGSGTAMAAAGTTAAGTTVAAGWANVAATAMVTSAASGTAISTINNKGNLGAVLKDVTSSDSLKGYVAAGVSGGIGGANIGVRLAVNSALKTVTSGGKFKDNLSQAAIGLAADALSAVIYQKVGDSLVGSGLSTKVAVHAIVGGLIGEAAGGDFSTSALAAGANKTLIGLVGDKIFPGEAHDQVLAMTSQLIGMTVAAAAGGSEKDQQVAGWVAQQATVNNFLKHEEVDELAKELVGCRVSANPTVCRNNVQSKYQGLSDSKTGVKLYGCKSEGEVSCFNQLADVEGGSRAFDRILGTFSLSDEERDIVLHFQDINHADERVAYDPWKQKFWEESGVASVPLLAGGAAKVVAKEVVGEAPTIANTPKWDTVGARAEGDFGYLNQTPKFVPVVRFTNGDLFSHSINTSKGPVDFIAETVIRGETLVLKDVAVYGQGSAALTGLQREIFRASSELKEFAKQQGFKRLEIKGTRVENSSSARPGHDVNLGWDLL